MAQSTPGVTLIRPPNTTIGMANVQFKKFYGSAANSCRPYKAPHDQLEEFSLGGSMGGPNFSSGAIGGLAISDLAIVELTGPLALPRVPRVYTGYDFIERALDSTFQNQRKITGVGNSVVFPLSIRNLIIDQSSTDRTNMHLLPATPLIDPAGAFTEGNEPYYIRFDREDGEWRARSGDSGGPNTFVAPDGVPVIFGVHSGFLDKPFDYSLESPTWDNRNGNGEFIRGFFTDADEDGVDDLFDNCPPSRCPDNPFRCSNPDQADADSDGIGDKCDRAPGSLCAARGWPQGICKFANETDSDGDGVADALDSCPLKPNGGPSSNSQRGGDEDDDGVGNECDNCSKKNGYRICSTDADCGGQPCVGKGLYGQCVITLAGGTRINTSVSCATTSNCHADSGETCENFVHGRCAVQLDDPEGDGLGGPCDSCNSVKDARITANSNIDAERRGGAEERGDLCDPVPQLVSRAIVGRLDLRTGAFRDDASSNREVTTFYTTAGLGAGGNEPSISDHTGFRYCSCIRTNGTIVPREMCAVNECRPSSASYVDGILYKAVTTAWSTNLDRRPTEPRAVNQEPATFFDREVNCDRDFPHASFGETCRLGSTRRITLWDHPADIARGVVRTVDGGPILGPKSAGIFMSHVFRTASSKIPDPLRDTQELRDTLEYVETPLFKPVDGARFDEPFTDCVLDGCMMWWRPDWVVRPPDDYRTRITELDLVAYFGRFVRHAGTRFTIAGRIADPPHDVTSSLSVGTRALLGTTGLSFLSPVEDGIAGSKLRSRVPFVAMPTPWRQAGRRPAVAVARDGQIALLDEGRLTDTTTVAALGTSTAMAAHPLDSGAWVPGDRDASRAVFSGSEGAVYLVGGHRPNGDRAGEVWRYSVENDEWTPLFLGQPVSTHPGDVRAIAYDDRTQRIVVIDDWISGAGTPNQQMAPAAVSNPRRARILVIDTRHRTIKVAAILPRTDRHRRVSLIHRGDGEFLVLRADKDLRSFTTHAFRIDANGAAEWIGKRQDALALLDDPIRTPHGVIAPVERNGAHDLVLLTTTASRESPADL